MLSRWVLTCFPVCLWKIYICVCACQVKFQKIDIYISIFNTDSSYLFVSNMIYSIQMCVYRNINAYRNIYCSLSNLTSSVTKNNKKKKQTFYIQEDAFLWLWACGKKHLCDRLCFAYLYRLRPKLIFIFPRLENRLNVGWNTGDRSSSCIK